MMCMNTGVFVVRPPVAGRDSSTRKHGPHSDVWRPLQEADLQRALPASRSILPGCLLSKALSGRLQQPDSEVPACQAGHYEQACDYEVTQSQCAQEFREAEEDLKGR